VNNQLESIEESDYDLTDGTILAFALRDGGKPQRNVIQYCHSLDQDLNLGLPKYEAGLSATRSQHML
jgi:hypothetical protein